MPALIVLLPAGFVAGALSPDVDPVRLLGPAFQPLVTLAVSVILYDAGLGLDVSKLGEASRRPSGIFQARGLTGLIPLEIHARFTARVGIQPGHR